MNREQKTITVDGIVAPGYEPVENAFRRNFTDHGEVGAALCVYVDGEVAIDLAGGRTAEGAPYTADNLQFLFSATKGIVAVIASMLEQRGLLDLDAPVASVWPEFAAAGKQTIPISWVLSHQSGLAAPPNTYSHEELLDGTRLTNDLAAMEPLWEPGTIHGYHASTYGYLMNEIIRRATGKSVGTVLAGEIAGPLGLDLWIGLPESQEHRVATLLDPPSPGPEIAGLLAEAFAPGSLGWRALSLNGSLEFGVMDNFENRRDVHAAELPQTNGIATARSLSKLYAACLGEVDGVRLLSDAQLDRARRERVRGRDAVWGFETAFGLGCWLHTQRNPKLGPGSFGHQGPGSLGFADPDHGVAFGYVVNQPGLLDPRSENLIKAVRECLPM
jgi:CubicO group peptidase (beta-lactamase class C family)